MNLPPTPTWTKPALLNRMLRALDLCSPEDLTALAGRLETERDSDEIAPPVAAVYAILATLADLEWQEKAGEALLGVSGRDAVMIDPDEARDDDE